MVSNALAKSGPPKAQPIAPVAITFDPLAVDSATVAAIEELNALQDVSIDTQEDADFAAEALREVVREKDAIAEMRARLLSPIKAATDAINALFKPALDARAASERKIKELLGGWDRSCRERERKALAEAAAAAQARNPAGITQALTAAQDCAPQKLDGVAVREFWKVKRIAADLLPPEWLCPDEKKIAAYARNFDPNKDPNGTIPGVIFERDSSVSARR